MRFSLVIGAAAAVGMVAVSRWKSTAIRQNDDNAFILEILTDPWQ
jgi:hypothetical protein